MKVLKKSCGATVVLFLISIILAVLPPSGFAEETWNAEAEELDEAFGSEGAIRGDVEQLCQYRFVVLGVVEKTTKAGTFIDPPRAIIRVERLFRGDPGYGKLNVGWQKNDCMSDDLATDSVEPPKVGSEWVLGINLTDRPVQCGSRNQGGKKTYEALFQERFGKEWERRAESVIRVCK